MTVGLPLPRGITKNMVSLEKVEIWDSPFNHLLQFTVMPKYPYRLKIYCIQNIYR